MKTFKSTYNEAELQEKFCIRSILEPKAIPAGEAWDIKEFRINDTSTGVLRLKIVGRDPHDYDLKYFENGQYKLYAPVRLNSLVSFGFQIQGLDSNKSVMLHVLGIKMVQDDYYA